MSTEPRELTRRERTTIRRLVTEICASYDPKYGCLPLDYGGCYMLDKCWAGTYCKYIQKAVLPLDPVLEATLTGQKTLELDNCSICGKSFIPEGKQTYCSLGCADTTRRKRQREYMRKRRANC